MINRRSWMQSRKRRRLESSEPLASSAPSLHAPASGGGNVSIYSSRKFDISSVFIVKEQ